MGTNGGMRDEPITSEYNRQQQYSEHRQRARCDSLVSAVGVFLAAMREGCSTTPLQPAACHSSIPRRIASATAAARSLTSSFS